MGFYDGAVTIDDADDVVVLASEVTSGIGGILGEVQPGTVSGRVTDGAGNPLAELAIQLLDEEGFMVRLGQTDENGEYEIIDLNPGTYYIYIADWLGFYLPEYYDDVTSFAEATPIVVSEAEPVAAGIDATLTQVGGISGSVLNGAGAPLLLAQVTAFRLEEGEWVPAAATLVDPAGNYQLGNLRPDTYRVEFIGFERDEDNNIVVYTEYYDNVATVAAGADVVVTAATLTSAVDARLGDVSAASGQIAGQVSNDIQVLANIEVHLYWEDRQGQWWALGHMTTDEAGQYAFAGLPDGRYHLCFVDPARLHLYECFDNSTHLNGATAVTISEGASINATATLAQVAGIYRVFLPITNR